MNKPTRRQVMQTAALSISAAVSSTYADDKQSVPAKKKTDRECVMEAGMTAAEADCWELIAKAAAKFFELPSLHPSEKQDVVNAIHVVQDKLLARPTYRKYLEAHRKDEKK